MRSLFLGALLGGSLLAVGCAPVYHPSSLSAPMHGEGGELHLASTGGTQGGQLHGSYAVGDYLAVRGLLQSYTSSNNHFHHFSAGTSVFGGTGRGGDGTGTGLRWAFSVDSGLADARGARRIRMFGADDERIHEGTVFRTAAQGDLGYAGRLLSAGIGARAAHVAISHSSGSDRAGERGNALYLEPMIFLRPGARPVKVDLQLGLSLPVTGAEEVASPFPLVLSAGLNFDL